MSNALILIIDKFNDRWLIWPMPKKHLATEIEDLRISDIKYKKNA